MSENVNSIEGYSLFNDVEDKVLQNQNRAVTLFNITEDYTKDRSVTARGADLILTYYKNLPNFDMPIVRELYSELLAKHGYKVTA